MAQDYTACRALEDDAKLELAAIIGPSPSPDHETGKA